MDSFFTVQAPNANPSLDAADSFANAIEKRHKIATFALPAATLAPLPQPTGPAASSSLPAPSSFPSISPSGLADALKESDTLVLDIRPHAAYSSARIPTAVSLSVPSTLLKRPLFSLQRLAAMLPSKTGRARFSTWRTAKCIIVYDADAHAVPDNSNILGLLRKFKNDGYEGRIFWLKGGFQAVWKERRDLVETRPPTPDNEHDDDDDDAAVVSTQVNSSVLRTRQLPLQAFSQSSTLMHHSPHNTASSQCTPSHHIRLPLTSQQSTSSHQAANPFFDTIRQNVELSHGITERIPLRLPRRESPLLSVTPACFDSSSEESFDDDAGPDPAVVNDGAEALAMQFYRIELAEQRRLMGIMEHHSKESGSFGDQSSGQPVFPFSITAGVEKGAKNRYRHIWPFEHARVKLHDKDDDYVNASYVQPLGTSKRYIATQGPLPATFTDFWTLCWEQNVHVIVMLTREVEGAMVKCGSYWTDNTFGPLSLRLVSTTGVVDSSEEPSGFFSAYSFDARSSRPSYPQSKPSSAAPHKHHHYHKSETIKRVFELRHSGFPDAKPRKIIHLQYLEWPDMNVPDDPRGLLGLVKQVDEAVAETGVRDEPLAIKQREGPINALDVDQKTGVAKHAMGVNSPVLLHCSAGVGRTGGFIAVDAILDSLRRQIHNQAEGQQSNGDPMIVDEPQGSLQRNLSPPPTASWPGLASQTLTSGHVVHFPVTDPEDMQVDDSDAPPPTSEISETDVVSMDFSRGSGSTSFQDTKRWAAGVDAERTNSESKANANGIAATPSTSKAGPVQSSSEESLLSNQTIFSNDTGSADPSSSTTSGASLPPFKPIPAFNSTLLLEPRERTSSAPAVPSPGVKKTMAMNLLRRPGAPPLLSLNLGNTASFSTPALSTSGAEQTASVASTFGANPRNALLSSRLAFDTASTAKSFDYKDPRPLHLDKTPPPLEDFEDPILEVLQDMREQRMSLCQSLRQYVFVHSAIIEGALMLLDEEKEANEAAAGREAGIGEKGATFMATSNTASTRQQRRRDGKKVLPPKTAPGRLASQKGSRHSRASSVSSNSPSKKRTTKRDPDSTTHTSPSRTRDAGYLPPIDIQGGAGMSSDGGGSMSGGYGSGGYASGGYVSGASTGGKRSASPTELLKEGKQGEVLLSKRPSVKTKGSGFGSRIQQHRQEESGATVCTPTERKK
ncbi:protein-tyrosine-phosphatase [Coprinopsis sp. MPI-PUGE-AT-0042]|nr:protein-tyrosine-phosphatase [Coprinopsis sp. MPI-PUGE-AT-0042]